MKKSSFARAGAVLLLAAFLLAGCASPYPYAESIPSELTSLPQEGETQEAADSVATEPPASSSQISSSGAQSEAQSAPASSSAAGSASAPASQSAEAAPDASSSAAQSESASAEAAASGSIAGSYEESSSAAESSSSEASAFSAPESAAQSGSASASGAAADSSSNAEAASGSQSASDSSRAEDASSSAPDSSASSSSDSSASASEAEADAPVADGESWSVFVYMSPGQAESEHGYASIALREMMNTAPRGNLRVVVQTGGSESWGGPDDAALRESYGAEDGWGTEDIDPNKLGRYEVRDGELLLVEEREPASMGGANALYEFLSWGVAQYPADRMMVVLWGEGGPAYSIARDPLFGDDPLLLPEAAQAFERLAPEMEGKFACVALDCGMMANLETYGALAPYADTLVASQDAIPGAGLNYTTLLKTLSRTPEAGGEALGRALCDDTLKRTQSNGVGGLSTFCVVDLSKADALTAAFDDFAALLAEGLSAPETLADISRAAAASQSYPGGLLDLKDFAARLTSLDPDTCEALLAACEEAVLYTASGAARQAAGGVSFYYPVTTAATPVDYGVVGGSHSYLAFLTGLSVAHQKSLLTGSPLDALAEAPVAEDGARFELPVDDGTLNQLSQVGYELFAQADGQAGPARSLGVGLGELPAKGPIQTELSGLWPTIDATPLMVQGIWQGEGYNLLSIPVEHNGAATSLWAVQRLDAEEGDALEVLCLRELASTGDALYSRHIVPLAEQDTLRPLYYAAQEGPADASAAPERGSSVTIEAETALRLDPLAAGSYQFQYLPVSLYGDAVPCAALPFELEAADAPAESGAEDASPSATSAPGSDSGSSSGSDSEANSASASEPDASSSDSGSLSSSE